MRRLLRTGPAGFAAFAASIAFVLAGCGGGGGGGVAPITSTDGPAGTISGSVLEAVTGALSQASAAGEATKPSKGAKVSIPGTNLSTVTDENGEYTIVGVPEGVHEVLIEKDVDADGKPDLVVRVPDIEVKPDKGKKHPPVEVVTPGAISGTATLAGATSGNLGIVVFVPGTSYAAYADDAGLYTITGVPAGTWDVAAQKAGYEAARIADLLVVAGETGTGVDFSLALSTSTRTGAVTGSARLVGATSHAGATITLSGVGATATTDADGSYTLADVPEGIYPLTAAAEGYATVHTDNVIVLNGATYTVPRLYLANLAAVTDFDGDGIPDVDDNDDDNDGYTDAQETGSGSDPRDPRSRPVGSIAGRVELSGQTSHANVMVAIQGSSRIFITADDGGYVFTDVPLGTWTLAFLKRNYDDATAAGVAVAAGQITEVALVTLSAGAASDAAAPTGTVLAAGTVTDTGIALTWTPATDDTSAQNALVYRVYAVPYNYNAVTGLIPIAVTAAGIANYTLTGLTGATLYTCAVLAVDESGNAEALGAANKLAVLTTTPGVAPPAAPTLDAPTAGDGTVTLMWSSVSDATGYNLYYATTPGVTSAASRLAGVTSSFAHTGLSNGAVYYYALAATNSGGESTLSGEVSATPVAPQLPPAAPVLDAPGAGDGRVTLTWAAVSGATAYTLYWGTSTGVTTTNGTAIAGASSPYVHTGLTNGAAYYYVLTASNAAGESALSGEVSATPQPAVTAPAAPTLDAPTAGDARVTLTWAAVSGAASYNLYYGTSAEVTAGSTKVAGVTSSYTHTSLTNGTTYYFAVSAVNAAGESVLSGEVSATPAVATTTGAWTLEKAAAPWSARGQFPVVAYDNKIWVLGGGESLAANANISKNDIWSSPDGVNWTQVSAAAQWSARRMHTALSFEGRMWVLGGYDGTNKSDVWSSTNGVDWTQVTAAAGWSGRWDHRAVVFNDKMWVLGGVGGGYKNDVWSSPDGLNWTQETAAAPWSGRQTPVSVVFSGLLWMFGGWDGSTLYNDVWSSADGINWNQVSAAASWNARRHHATAVFNARLWVIGGWDDGAYTNDVWSSADGLNWTQETAAAPWGGRAAHASVVFNAKLWVLGGSGGGLKNDVWSFQ